ncbi:SusC outer membrane protein [Algibacter lectus]|uniref:SusC outer membrane protein n=1 Tax=Algibacter lectus TaxID=221126 RepID=A0A090X2G5_9FLAO|nr:carboxypeptidase-like regulatory domain-containing protein [Algibacter lectus]GAL82594.1 SusC outer membrane protein [Algibacter lectus]
MMKLKQLFFTPVFALMSLWVQAQVTGTVTSLEDGMPMPGVSVIVSGTTQGAATDFDGNYVLDNIDSNATLVFSYVGYKTQEIQINGRSVINVVLTEDAASLDEIIVTGYARERKVDVTGGAITVVELGPTEGVSMSSGSAVQGGLQGRVPGGVYRKIWRSYRS